MTRRPLPVLRVALAALLAGALAACGTPRPLGERPADRVVVPTSTVHYRAFGSADALAAYLRWQPGAPRLLSAHRGAPPPGLPENSLAAFEHALNVAPALIETDVRPTADGRLVLMHDETLDRTTTGAGRLDATPFAALRALRLRAATGAVTPFRVPTLAEALAWADGRAVLMLDVKRDVPVETLVAAIREARAENRVVVITYTLEAHRAVARLAPDLMVSATAETTADVEALLASGLDLSRVIAFAGVGVPDPAVVARLHAAGIRVQAATFETDPEALARADASLYAPYLAAGADVLATDHLAGAAVAAQTADRRERSRR